MAPPSASAVSELDLWVDTHDAWLIDHDVLDYPGACEAADRAVIEARDRDTPNLLSNEPGAIIEYQATKYGLDPQAVLALSMQADYTRKTWQVRPLYFPPSLDDLQERAWQDSKKLRLVK